MLLAIDRQGGGTVEGNCLAFMLVMRDRGDHLAVGAEHLQPIVPGIRHNQMTAVVHESARTGETPVRVLFFQSDARVHAILPHVSSSSRRSTQFPLVGYLLLAHLPVVAVLPCRSRTLTGRDIQGTSRIKAEVRVVERVKGR